MATSRRWKAELSPFVPETFGELLGVSDDPDDYERHSWSRRLVVGQFESGPIRWRYGETEIEGDRQGLHGQRRFRRTAWQKAEAQDPQKQQGQQGVVTQYAESGGPRIASPRSPRDQDSFAELIPAAT